MSNKCFEAIPERLNKSQYASAMVNVMKVLGILREKGYEAEEESFYEDEGPNLSSRIRIREGKYGIFYTFSYSSFEKHLPEEIVQAIMSRLPLDLLSAAKQPIKEEVVEEIRSKE